MKIEIIKEKFLEGVTLCERISGKHVSLPVLSCIILEARNKELVVKATNLDVGIEVVVPAKVTSEGIVALSGAVLKSFLANSEGEKNILLEQKENEVVVSAGESKASIKTMPAEDFPVIPKVDEGRKFKINAKDFVSGITAVWYSASMSSIKPELSSVYIYTDEEGLVFVSTDSFRLAEKKIKVKKSKDDNFSMLVPFKNISEISRVFDGLDEEVEILGTKNQVSFFAPGIHITSRVVDGNFPDYKQIIPKTFTSTVTVLKQDFLQALKLTNAFSDNFNQVIFTISPSKKTLEMKTKNSDVGEGTQSIKGSFSGEELTITFNHKYVFDCLSSIESESVTLNFSGAGKPLVISPSHNVNFVYLVMPMNR